MFFKTECSKCDKPQLILDDKKESTYMWCFEMKTEKFSVSGMYFQPKSMIIGNSNSQCVY